MKCIKKADVDLWDKDSVKDNAGSMSAKIKDKCRNESGSFRVGVRSLDHVCQTNRKPCLAAIVGTRVALGGVMQPRVGTYIHTYVDPKWNPLLFSHLSGHAYP